MKRGLRNIIAVGIVELMHAAYAVTTVYAADCDTALSQSGGGQMMQGDGNNVPPDISQQGENPDVSLPYLTVKDTGQDKTIAGGAFTSKMIMKSVLSYTGAINGDNSTESITLTLDKSSKIKLTGDSYVSSLENADTSNSNIDFNGYTLYVNGKAVN